MNKIALTLALVAFLFAGTALADSDHSTDNDTTAVGVGVGVGLGGHGGNAMANSISGSGVFKSGNSDVDVDASSRNVNVQGQRTDVNTSDFNTQGQNQGQNQGINFSDDDSVVYKEAENSASSPGALILGTCQAGVAAQTQMGGGSLGGPDEVCLYFTLSQMYYSQGNQEAAAAALKRAEDTLRWRNNVVRRAFQAIPLIGRMF